MNTLKGDKLAPLISSLLGLEPSILFRFEDIFITIGRSHDVSFVVSISFKVNTLKALEQNFLKLNGTCSEYTSITFPDFNPREFGVSKSSTTFPSTLNSNKYAFLQI